MPNLYMGGLEGAAGSIISGASITGAEPRLLFNESDAGANGKLWDFDVNGGVFSLRTRTDLDGAGNTAWSVTRSGTTVSSVTMWVPVQIRNGATSQSLKVYNSYTDASNNEFLVQDFSSNSARIYTDKLGSGTYRNLQFGAAGVQWDIDTNGYMTPITDNNVPIGSASKRLLNLFSVIGTFGTTPADAGTIRLGNASLVNFRNVANSGNVQALTVDTSNRIKIGGSGNSTVFIDAQSANTVIQNSALLAFEGQTSSFPALKRSATLLAFRLADDSADAGISLSTAVMSGMVTTYNNVATAGWGVPAIYGSGIVSAETGRSAAIATYTVGATAGVFHVSGNINVTASTTHSFSLDVSYTDEGGTPRVMILPMAALAGSFITGGLITNVTGAGPYESPVMEIRCAAASTITIRPSAGTFTTVTYNGSAIIEQVR